MPARKKEQVLHIRRCHVCGTVNESESAAILNCKNCGKHLAPFFFFDESSLEGLSECGPYLSQVKQLQTVAPIWGLSTYWTEDNKSMYKDEHETHGRRHKKRKKKHPTRYSRNGD